MKTNIETLLREALSLPEDARLDLVVALLESVEDGPTGEGIGGAWSAEAKRRLKEVRTGAVKPVSWEEAESQILDPPDGQKGRRRGPRLERVRPLGYSRYQVPERRVTRLPKGRVHELPYLVEIPIPYVDRRGRLGFAADRGDGADTLSGKGASMRKTKAHVVEVVPDADLRKKEAKARAVVKRFFPNAGPVRLYRTADGRIGCQLDVTITAGDRKRLDQAYEAIMDVVGERRGRPRGVKKVQTKLMLPETAYLALKRAAAASNETMSGLVAQLAEGLARTGTR